MKSVFVLALALVAVAVPAPDAIAARRVDIALCKEEKYVECTILKDVEKRRCTDVPSNLDDRIRSITFWGADQCTFWINSGCDGRNFTDAGDMPELKKRFSEKISSFECN